MLNDEAIGLKWTREQLALLFYKLVSWYIDVYTDADGWSLSELLTLMRLFNYEAFFVIPRASVYYARAFRK